VNLFVSLFSCRFYFVVLYKLPFYLKSTNAYLRSMKIKLLVVGATPKNFLKEGEDLYIKRLNKLCAF